MSEIMLDRVEQSGLIIQSAEPLSIVGGTYNVSETHPLQVSGNVEFRNATFNGDRWPAWKNNESL